MDIAGFLASHEAFAGLVPSEINQLAASAREMEFRDADLVIKKGEHGKYVWVVLEGEAAVVVPVEQNTPRKILATVRRGELVGEMSVMTGDPTRVDVEAHGHLKALRLDGDLFRQMAKKHGTTMGRLARTMTKRYSELGRGEK